MKSLNPVIVFLAAILLFLPGCDLIGDIFEAGFWTALIVIIAVIALIIWGLSSFSQSKKSISH
jgi:L-asparagine transporter-like permease